MTTTLLRLATALRNAQLDQVRSLFDNGYLRFYTGNLEATPETAESGTLLAELRLNTTAYGTASGGQVTFNGITSCPSAPATGTVGHFRILKSDGTTALLEGNIGTTGCIINLNSTSIQAGAPVSVSSLTWTIPMETAT